MRLWVRYALQCKVQELRLSIHGKSPAFLRPEDPPLASRHLTRLSLHGLVFSDDFLDLSRCPVLQYLHIADCSFRCAERISLQSLKYLNITRGMFNRSFRTRIHTPNLASLLLHVTYGRAPVLERMPLLVRALLVISGDCNCDCCSRSINGDCGDESCNGCIRNDTSSVLLHGISQARTLVLAAGAEMFIFRRDLKWCPTFSRLKTLSLNENWCVPDVHPLACTLQHSPVLEKLSLSLFYKGFNVTMKGRIDPEELPPTISAQINRVEVTCGVVDERATKVLKFLSKLNISFSF
ncbi:hypothetical protein PAHAL_8G062700 [Panicum hallii]|uniref:FBD domain-containing protein n=1 Tax=Panicum hallii TaxID=206008 RepID=A0A2S3ID38_9POAL|nr:uncharacterized protein LOC112903446 isoform X2 [Panicum hallii]PAN41676.1 hypothetical protein PAHAL_8G062700 [Panicum hallii]